MIPGRLGDLDVGILTSMPYFSFGRQLQRKQGPFAMVMSWKCMLVVEQVREDPLKRQSERAMIWGSLRTGSSGPARLWRQTPCWAFG